jgi:transposase-like protein
MDEMCLVIKGKKNWLWREVDQDGFELDIYCYNPEKINKLLSDFLRNY